MDKHTQELLNHQRTAYEKQLAEIRQSREECSNDAGARKRKLDDQAQEMATLEKEIATLKNELLKHQQSQTVLKRAADIVPLLSEFIETEGANPVDELMKFWSHQKKKQQGLFWSGEVCMAASLETTMH